MLKISDFLVKYKKNKFIRNVATAATGSAGAQVLTLLFAPFITRLYSPDAFGMLGSFMALVAILGALSALSYPLAIVQPKLNVNALQLTVVSVFIAVVTSLIVAIGVFLFGEIMGRVYGLADFLYLLPMVMFLIGCQQAFQQQLIRNELFKKISAITIANSLIVNLLKICSGLFLATGTGLIFITCLSFLISMSLMWLGARHIVSIRQILQEIKRCKLSGLVSIAKDYKDFPIYRAPQIAVNSFSQVLPVLMLGSLFSLTAAGYYTLSRSVLGIPTTFVGKAIGDVFYPRITNAKHNGEKLSRLIAKATLVLVVIGIFPFSIVVVTGPWLFTFVFGSEWGDAGSYSQWLSVWLFFGFVNRPSVAAIPVINQQSWLLIYELFSTGLKVMALGVGFYIFKSDLVAVALFSLLGALSYIYLILKVMQKSRDYDEKKTSK